MNVSGGSEVIKSAGTVGAYPQTVGYEKLRGPLSLITNGVLRPGRQLAAHFKYRAGYEL